MTTVSEGSLRATQPERSHGRGWTNKPLVSALVAALLLTLAIAGAWADTVGTEQNAGYATQAVQYGDDGDPAGHRGAEAIRPHPRGLPRKAIRAVTPGRLGERDV